MTGMHQVPINEKLCLNQFIIHSKCDVQTYTIIISVVMNHLPMYHVDKMPRKTATKMFSRAEENTAHYSKTCLVRTRI